MVDLLLLVLSFCIPYGVSQECAVKTVQVLFQI